MTDVLLHPHRADEITASAARRYEIIDRFEVERPADSPGLLQIWCPVIADNPCQRVLDLCVTAEQPWRLTRDPEFGNVILYGRYSAPAASPLSFELRYLVERLPVAVTLDPSVARPLPSAQPFLRALQAEQYVDVDERTRRLAAEVVGRETNPLRQARLIYDHVAAAMRYNAAEQSWKGSTEHALACSIGNCNDIHALFVSLCRSVGIPSRFVMGQALEAPPEGGEACDLCGYHCWAEFFVAGLGWIPADASCACKYGKHGLFGDLESNHVAWSVGRDILFEPPQHAGRSLFFAGPYAELDGRAHPVARRINFAERN